MFVENDGMVQLLHLIIGDTVKDFTISHMCGCAKKQDGGPHSHYEQTPRSSGGFREY